MSSRFSPFLALLASLLLGGLTGCVDFTARPLSAETGLKDFSQRKLNSPKLLEFLQQQGVKSPAADGVWDFPTLALVAYYYHPDLDLARTQFAAAQGVGVSSGERPNPTLALAPGYNSTVGPPWIYGVTLDLTWETAGKRGYRQAQAAHLTEAAQLNLAATAWQVRGRVRKALLALHASGESITLLKKLSTTQGEAFRLLELQHKAGAISAYEVTQARASLNQSRFALQDAENLNVTARMQLAEAIGVTPAALIGVKFNLTEFKKIPTAVPTVAAQRQALLHRADILGGLAEYAAAQSALQLAIAKQYPDVHFSPGWQMDQTDNKWSLGLGFDLPLFNRNQGGIAEAEANRSAAAAKFNALQARVISDVAQAIANYRGALRKTAAAQALNHDIATQFSTAETMLAAGEISRVELALRQQELTTVALAQAEALNQALQALGALDEMLQAPGGIEAALTATNR